MWQNTRKISHMQLIATDENLIKIELKERERVNEMHASRIFFSISHRIHIVIFKNEENLKYNIKL